TAASRSASAKMMLGDFPPSSSDRRLMLPADALMIDRPVSVEPVNAILSTSSCAARSAPASPYPVTTLTTPAGSPASTRSSTRRNADREEFSDGLTTTVQPAASAGAIFQIVEPI